MLSAHSVADALPDGTAVSWPDMNQIEGRGAGRDEALMYAIIGEQASDSMWTPTR
jgi:hypothetical protein